MIPNNQKNQGLASARVASSLYDTTAIAAVEDNRLTRARIKLWIPKNYHQEPVISHLVSDHGITVNITAAPSGENVRDDRWFSLELRGKAKQISSALSYLKQANLDIWNSYPVQ